jgi:hypothetical protein
MTERTPIREETSTMGNAVRWAVAVTLGLLLLGMIAYARGEEHYRGDERGALGPHVVAVTSLVDAAP